MMNYQNEYQCLGCPYTDACDTFGCIRLLNTNKVLENQELDNNSYEYTCQSNTMP